MEQSVFAAALQIEDNEILVYSGEFAGIPSEFVFSFVNDQLASGMIFVYNSAQTLSGFDKLKSVLVEKYGEPSAYRTVNALPELTWAFLSSYKQPPDYAYIKLFPSKGSLLGKDRKNRSVIIMMSADHELEEQYKKEREASRSK